jgi:predicted outer membrane repeat protein
MCNKCVRDPVVFPALMLGADKAKTIVGTAVLHWYLELFERELAQLVKLMIIGYGFRDPHINEILLRGARAGYMKPFLVDTLGAKALDQNNSTRGGAIYVRSELDEVLSPP